MEELTRGVARILEMGGQTREQCGRVVPQVWNRKPRPLIKLRLRGLLIVINRIIFHERIRVTGLVSRDYARWKTASLPALQHCLLILRTIKSF